MTQYNTMNDRKLAMTLLSLSRNTRQELLHRGHHDVRPVKKDVYGFRYSLLYHIIPSLAYHLGLDHHSYFDSTENPNYLPDPIIEGVECRQIVSTYLNKCCLPSHTQESNTTLGTLRRPLLSGNIIAIALDRLAPPDLLYDRSHRRSYAHDIAAVFDRNNATSLAWTPQKV